MPKKTNVFGAMNVIEAAILSGVKDVVALSTDKASSPINRMVHQNCALTNYFLLLTIMLV